MQAMFLRYRMECFPRERGGDPDRSLIFCADAACFPRERG